MQTNNIFRIGVPGLVLACLGAAIGGKISGNEVFNRKPHIVIFSIDTLRADHLGCYGYGKDTSPNIDKFVKDSVFFKNAYSQAPITTPSHMTLFTALSPPVHGINNICPVGLNHRLAKNIKTITELLQEKGYINVGIHGGGQVDGKIGFDRGFDEYNNKFGRWEKSLGKNSLERFKTITDCIVGWLDTSRDKGEPLFLFLHHYLCHDPYVKGPTEFRDHFVDINAADPVLNIRNKMNSSDFWRGVDLNDPLHRRYIISLYDGGVYYSDYVFGRVMDTLKNNGIYDDSLIILLSDHGEEFNEHGGKTHGRLWNEHLYVPLIIKFPGNQHAEMVIEEPVRIMDVLPTVCDYIKIPVNHPIQGISFLPLIVKTGVYDPLIVSYRTSTHHEVIDNYSIKIMRDGYAYIRHLDPFHSLLKYQPPAKPVSASREIAAAEEVVAERPNGYVGRGDRYFEEGQFKSAIEMYQEATKVNPEDIGTYLKLANVYRQMKEYEKEEQIFEEALVSNSNKYVVYLEWGRYCLENEDYKKAGEKLTKARELNPADPWSYFEEGQLWRGRGNIGKAISLYEKAIERNTNERVFHIALARAYRKQREYDKALEEFKAAVLINPSAQWLFREMAIICRNIGKLAELESLYQSIRKNNPSLAWVYYALGDYYESQGRLKEAEQIYQQLLENNPDESGGYILLGDLCLGQKQFSRAKKLYGKARSVDPRNPGPYFGLGVLYRQTRKFRKSEQLLKKAIEMGGDKTRGYIELGRLYSQQGKLEDAELMYERAAAVSPRINWQYDSTSLFRTESDRQEQDNILNREDVIDSMLTLEKQVREENEYFLRLIDKGFREEFKADEPLSRQLKALGYMN